MPRDFHVVPPSDLRATPRRLPVLASLLCFRGQFTVFVVEFYTLFSSAQEVGIILQVIELHPCCDSESMPTIEDNDTGHIVVSGMFTENGALGVNICSH